jgi:hypothetical protein
VLMKNKKTKRNLLIYMQIQKKLCLHQPFSINVEKHEKAIRIKVTLL